MSTSMTSKLVGGGLALRVDSASISVLAVSISAVSVCELNASDKRDHPLLYIFSARNTWSTCGTRARVTRDKRARKTRYMVAGTAASALVPPVNSMVSIAIRLLCGSLAPLASIALHS